MTSMQIGILVVNVFAIVAAFFLGAYLVRSETRHKIEHLESISSMFQLKSGEHPDEGPYTVVTLDGGRNWWTVEIDGENIRPTGDARKMFPKATAMLKLEARVPGYVPEPKEPVEEREQPIRVIEEEGGDPYKDYKYNPGEAFGPERGASAEEKEERQRR